LVYHATELPIANKDMINKRVRVTMQKPLCVLAGAAILASAGLFAQPASAIGLPGSQSMQGAIADVDATDKVHCRPGVWHHRFRPHDGCFRRFYNNYSYYDPGYAYGPGYYGPGVGFYGPGVGFRFGFGGFGHRGRW
jgi:hypothetical protein